MAAAMQTAPYDTCRNSAMMKAAAPITGGINCPPVEPTELDRRRLVAREARLDHRRDGDDADREHVRDRAAGDHAEQAEPNTAILAEPPR